MTCAFWTRNDRLDSALRFIVGFFLNHPHMNLSGPTLYQTKILQHVHVRLWPIVRTATFRVYLVLFCGHCRLLFAIRSWHFLVVLSSPWIGKVFVQWKTRARSTYPVGMLVWSSTWVGKQKLSLHGKCYKSAKCGFCLKSGQRLAVSYRHSVLIKERERFACCDSHWHGSRHWIGTHNYRCEQETFVAYHETVLLHLWRAFSGCTVVYALGLLGDEYADRVELLLAEAPYNIWRELHCQSSDHNVFSKQKMTSLVNVIIGFIRHGAHGHIFWTDIRYFDWFDVLSDSTECVLLKMTNRYDSKIQG